MVSLRRFRFREPWTLFIEIGTGHLGPLPIPVLIAFLLLVLFTCFTTQRLGATSMRLEATHRQQGFLGYQ